MKGWLDNSAKIALKILRTIRDLKITQKELADKLNISPQHISKVLKGQENLTLETIDKLEKALNIRLIDIPEFETTISFEPGVVNEAVDYQDGQIKSGMVSFEEEHYTVSGDCQILSLVA